MIFVPWREPADSSVQEHFLVTREVQIHGDDVQPAVLTCTDSSLFINNEKLTKGQSQILLHADIIELKSFKKFQFVDVSDHNSFIHHEYPPEITNVLFVGAEIGTGLHGTVRLAHHPKTFKKLALKAMTKDVSRIDNILQEIQNMRKVDHPNILKLVTTIEDNDRVFLLTEYMGMGDMLNLLLSQPNRRLKESEAKYAICQVANGLHYIHNKNIAHLDVKFENILLEQKGDDIVYKLCDFGFSSDQEMVKTSSGTLTYISPEALQDKPYSGKKSDMWSLGVVLFATLSGFLPFDEDYKSTQGSLLEFEVEFDDEVWKEISYEAKDLIVALLTKNPDNRLTSSKIWSNTWFDDRESLDRCTKLYQTFKNIYAQESLAKSSKSPSNNIKMRLRRPSVFPGIN